MLSLFEYVLAAMDKIESQADGNRLQVSLGLEGFEDNLLAAKPAFDQNLNWAQRAADETRFKNNMRNIGLAMSQYYFSKGRWPFEDQWVDGKPMLSWARPSIAVHREG